MTFTNPSLATDLRGKLFRVPRYSCTWTVLSYHRGGNWVCQEPDHHTTCHFHEDEILAGLAGQVDNINTTVY